MTTTFQPVTETSREESLDTLRGFAIVGVLFALFLEWDNLGVPPGDNQTSAFKFIDQAANIFLHGKAYNILAFLFGYGFALQAMRAKHNGVNLLPFALRRALGLFILGTLHAVILRDGDIVGPYAICSLFIILLRNSSDKKILIAIGTMFLIPFLYFLILKSMGRQPAPWGGVKEGTGVFSKNIAYLLQHWYPHFIEIYSPALFLFFVGMYTSRKQWLEKLQNNPRQMVFVLLVGAVLCVINYFIPWQQILYRKIDFNSSDFYLSLFINFLRGITRLPFTWGIDLVYIAIILQLLKRNATRKMLQPLTNIGKMALTNYLLPDIFFIPLFFIFFNLWAKVPVLYQLLMASGFAIFLAVFSTWWLKRFHFGPFEWLLRSFTYWKWQPMKKKEIAV